MKPRFEIYQEYGMWYYKLIAGNGRELIDSDEYSSKCNATKACNIIQKAAKSAKIVYR